MRRGRWITIMGRLALGLLSMGAARAQEMMPPRPPAPPQTSFLVTQAYPCAPDGYPPGLNIADPACFAGRAVLPHPPGAVPGMLCLARRDNYELDVNCFVIPPPDATGPCFVQSYMLIKSSPYEGTFFQMGNQVRTWWSLNFSPPGTTFTLIINSVCPVAGPRPIRFKQDVYEWRVVAYPPTMLRLIDLMHSGAVGTMEIPCILSEDTYDMLVALVQELDRLTAGLSVPPTPEELRQVRDLILDLEQFLLANCLSVDYAVPPLLFPGPSQFGQPGYQPPGNQAGLVLFATAGSVGGILDTTENPCCSILLADLEFIAGFFDLTLGLDLPRLGGTRVPDPEPAP